MLCPDRDRIHAPLPSESPGGSATPSLTCPRSQRLPLSMRIHLPRRLQSFFFRVSPPPVSRRHSSSILPPCSVVLFPPSRISCSHKQNPSRGFVPAPVANSACALSATRQRAWVNDAWRGSQAVQSLGAARRPAPLCCAGCCRGRQTRRIPPHRHPRGLGAPPSSPRVTAARSAAWPCVEQKVRCLAFDL